MYNGLMNGCKAFVFWVTALSKRYTFAGLKFKLSDISGMPGRLITGIFIQN